MVSSTRKKPEIVLFAGPNGSGKSTFTEVLRPVMDYINADEIKKNLNFKKRKDVCFFDECDDWRRKNIEILTGIANMERKNLNHRM